MESLALSMIGRSRIQGDLSDLAFHVQASRNPQAQLLQQREIDPANREQMNDVHENPSTILISASRRHTAPAIALQLVVKSNPVNVENVSRPALVATTLLQNAQNVGALDFVQAFAGSREGALLLEDEVLLAQFGFLRNHHGALHRVFQ